MSDFTENSGFPCYSDLLAYVLKAAVGYDENCRGGKLNPNRIFQVLLQVCSQDDLPVIFNMEVLPDVLDERERLKERMEDDSITMAKRKDIYQTFMKASWSEVEDTTGAPSIWLGRAVKEAGPGMPVTTVHLCDAILTAPTKFLAALLGLNSKEMARRELVSNSERIERMEESLRQKIKGQDEAIYEFTRGLASVLMLDDNERKGPLAIFLFAGPPGVGKTLLATLAASEVPGYIFKRYDMGEYVDKEAVETLTGFDDTWKNSHEGILTGHVKRYPKSILLFDEIEKTTLPVLQQFLPMLDEGKVTDNFYHKDVSFRDTICIFTTNAGKSLYEGDHAEVGEISREVILEAFQTETRPLEGGPLFPPELCSRLSTGHIVMFRHLSANDLADIADAQFKNLSDNFRHKYNISITMDPAISGILLLRAGGESDARKFRSDAQEFFKDEIFKLTTYFEPENLKRRIPEIESINFTAEDLNIPGLAGSDNVEKEKVLVFTAGNPDFQNAVSQLEGAYDISFAPTYQEALRLLDENGPFLFIMALAPTRTETPKQLGDVHQHVDKIPFGANRLRNFVNFLDTLSDEYSDIPAYVFLMGRGTHQSEAEIGFLRHGAAKVIPVDTDKRSIDERGRTPYDRDRRFREDHYTRTIRPYPTGVSEYFDEHTAAAGNAPDKFDFATALNGFENKGREIRLEREATRYARQRLALRFETVPKHVDTELKIRLRDFREIRNISGEDRDAILFDEKIPDVSFDNIIGADDVKSELRIFVDYLKDPKQYLANGFEPPKGVLLYGPPGTGKTYLAEALAHEAGVAFFPANGGDFIGGGSFGVDAIDKLFTRARRYAPSIIFIDEIDAIGKERTGYASGVESTLNKLLSELDGFDNDRRKPVFVMAATNYAIERSSAGQITIDPALLRRFDRVIYVGPPVRESRKKYIDTLLENFTNSVSETMRESVAERCTGMNFSQIKNFVQLAARKAMADGDAGLDDQCFDNAFQEFEMGEKTDWDEKELQRVAFHEAGHALMCYLTKQPMNFISVIARGSYGGYVSHAEDSNPGAQTRQQLLDRILAKLGGRAAEMVSYPENGGGISTAASLDLAQATQIATAIVCSYGMDDDEGLAVFQGKEPLSKETKDRINTILKEQMDRALLLLSDEENLAMLKTLASVLIEKKQLLAEDIYDILNPQKSGA